MSDEVVVPDVTEADYRLMIDSILDTEIIMLDRKGNVLTWNEGAARILGYSAGEVLGRSVSMFYTAADIRHGAMERELQTATTTGRFESEACRVRKNGEEFWANIVVQPMHDKSGHVKGFVKVTRDLTEERKRDQELRMASVMLDSLAGYAITRVDADGTIRSWNKGAEQLQGYSASEAVGQNFGMFYSEEEMALGVPQQDLDEARRAGRFESEGWRTRKDGTRFQANITIFPVRDESGSHIGFVNITRDITERVERERLVQRQRDEILELSTPVIQIWERILVLPIIGTLDSLRAARLTESLLERIASDEAAIVILDISGVPMIDTAVAQHLFKTIQGARLMGADSIISGVRPETAQAMVHLGIDIGMIRSRSTLRDALQLAFGLLNERAVNIDLTAVPDGQVAPRSSDPRPL